MTSDTATDDDDPIRIAFVCVQNAGRSQMSAAFAERERAERGLGDDVEIVTGGTRPADEVHPEVVEPMGCSTLDLDAGADGDGPAGPEIRDWALEDPHGGDLDAVREIRDEIERRVSSLFDEVAEPAERRGP